MEHELKLEKSVGIENNEAQKAINYFGRPIKIIPERPDFKRRIMDIILYGWRMGK